ncbi:outer membrane receptor protein involved in Fe transport [Chitinophaga dinghuensis]|uniref:Outer membrane receptor protein involved in Fe transport n=1 Tax=Chitinophaga dinghuensis TaxID=1539050 RepID=A0A327VSY8_9BACT|nr:outer membrane beta-barrel family protein [Chitinophaga dinghuensis]RAJ79019.1 outer membrane receptor protein involved in Fe transport [Chitinophaga dinghuensis]
MTFKKIALAIVLLLSSHFLYAQTGKPGIKAVVKDATSQQPLDRATVILSIAGGNTNIPPVFTDSTGTFQLSNLAAATYQLTVGYAGFETYHEQFTIKATDKGLIEKVILLHTNTKMLNGIQVTAKKQLVENKIDRLVYNVESDVTSQGAMVADVLRKVPQVTVDASGNVELLGNPSVQFLINGKPSTMFGTNVADVLQSIPASQIQSVEVMSSPGSKYDAKGTGGIINIILKKNKSQGFSGTINATAGTRLENGAVNLFYKANNISVTGYFNGSAQTTVRTKTTVDRYAIDSLSKDKYYLQQNGGNDFNRSSYQTGLGVDWTLSSSDNLAFSLSYNHFSNRNEGSTNQYSSTRDMNGILLDESSNIRDAGTKVNNSTLDLSLDYRHKFKRDKQELSVVLFNSNGDNHTSYFQTQHGIGDPTILSGSRSLNPGTDHLYSVAIDYAQPISSKLLLEAGVKTEAETLSSTAGVYTFSPKESGFVHDNQQSYSSVFKRQVYAGYVSGTMNLFNYLNVLAGFRWEYTTNKSTYDKVGQSNVPDYSNAGPSLTVAHTFKGQQTLSFSYSYRLERPDYRDLNPFVNLTDPHNITMGNPLLKPEIGNDFKLAFNQNFNGDNNLNIVLLYTRNSPDIKSYTTFYGDYMIGDSLYSNVNVTKRDNIAAETRIGTNISGTVSIGRKITIRPNVQLYRRETNNIYSTPTHISGFEYRFNLNSSWQINKDLVAEVFGNYKSGIRWQGRTAEFYSYTLAVKKQLFNNKGSIGLVAVNPFAKYLTQTTIQETDYLHSTNQLYIPYRSFGINFMYKFGKIKTAKSKDTENFLTKPPVEN